MTLLTRLTAVLLFLAAFLITAVGVDAQPAPATQALQATSVGTDPKASVQLAPQNPNLNSLPPTSPDAPINNQPASIDFRPWNTGNMELDLWRMENRKFIRSDVVVSPGRDMMAYTEVTYLPIWRQTFSRLFVVPFAQKAPPPESQMLPEDFYQWQEEQARIQAEEQRLREQGKPTPSEIRDASRYNPDMHLQDRRELLSVGKDRTHPWFFETLTVVDWSATGKRLLFKRRSGILYLGLRTSDILVYDKERGTVTIYPELHRIISNFWDHQGTLAPLDDLAWDIYPMGWAPGSDSVIYLRVWAYDKRERKFLGIWQYDVEAQRTELVNLQDVPVALAANGMVPSSSVVYDTQSGQWYRKGEGQ